MSSLPPPRFRKAPAFFGHSYIIRQAREFCIADVDPIFRVAKKEDGINKFFYKNLKLTFYARNPIASLRINNSVLEKCLAYNNVEAHYIKGVMQFFYDTNLTDGLYHLKQAADGSHASGTLLYGVLLLCLGNMVEGKMYLDMLSWETRKPLVDRCWIENRRAIRGLGAVFTRQYQRNMLRIKPPSNCHDNDLQDVCGSCFYFKQLQKFLTIL